MRATGIVRKTDELGRIVIPKEVRTKFNWEEGTPLDIYTEGETVILKRYQQGCVFCGSLKDVTRYMDKLVCQECIDSLK